MKRKLIYLILIVLHFSNVNAQQEAQFTQYLDNMIHYNPAYAGSRGHMHVAASARQQWIGFSGAPSTQSMFIHCPLKYESASLGFTVLNDRVGPVNQSTINGVAAYALKFKRSKGKLSFGVSGGINLINGDLTQLYAVDANDPLAEVYANEMRPNIGGGVYYHSEKWFAGISAPQILENSSSITNLSLNSQRHYYLSAGAYFKINRMLKIRPSTLIKVTENAPLAADLSVAFMFYDRLWLGANYRLTESAGALFQIQINNQLKFGYSFDFSTSTMVRHNYGTHELILSYDFVFKRKSITTPRYF